MARSRTLRRSRTFRSIASSESGLPSARAASARMRSGAVLSACSTTSWAISSSLSRAARMRLTRSGNRARLVSNHFPKGLSSRSDRAVHRHITPTGKGPRSTSSKKPLTLSPASCASSNTSSTVNPSRSASRKREINSLRLAPSPTARRPDGSLARFRSRCAPTARAILNSATPPEMTSPTRGY